ncbi:hypothetical protein Dimus_034293 [Dionaea muscipula]
MEVPIEYNNGSYSPSLKMRVKNTLCSCFKNQHHHGGSRGGGRGGFSSVDDHLTPRLLRSSSQWVKFKSRGQEIPEFKDKCRNLISRMGNRRRTGSTDFRYDPLSYALNFDEGDDHHRDVDEFSLRNFSARLPQSPPSSAPAAAGGGFSEWTIAGV